MIAISKPLNCSAFEGCRLIASGGLPDVARKTKEQIDAGHKEEILIFNDETSALIELDLRGTVNDVVERAAALGNSELGAIPLSEPVKRGPGRPKLGVTGREVTLLPRHWDWLESQPGGASVALRRLVEEARRSHTGKDRARRSQDAVYRFLSAMAGNLPGFEEALRSFYNAQFEQCNGLMESWPTGVRDHARKLVLAAAQDANAAKSPRNSGAETGS